MVGLVLVSHSRALANALAELVGQVTHAQLPLVVAAGVGPDRSEFGTDAVEIMEAILQVASDDGVVVLMDLGSAVLSAQMAVELLPPEIAAQVIFCAAPLVEGAIAAAVQVSLGSDRETICREAKAALMPKQEQIGDQSAEASLVPPVPEMLAADQQRLVVRLPNPHGLHARPAARFVQTASSFNAELQVRNLTNGKGPVSARSLNAVAVLGAVKDHELEITASGPQAAEALQALRRLAEDGFGELEEMTMPAVSRPAETAGRPGVAPVEPGALAAVAISEGVALGRLHHHRAALPPIPDEPAHDRPGERRRLEEAVRTVGAAIAARQRQTEKTIGKQQAAIFEAHVLILNDPEMMAAAAAGIEQRGENAARAWQTAVDATAQTYRDLDDDYLRQRAADVLDVGRQVLLELAGATASAQMQPLDHPVILYAPEITPTETSQLNLEMVLGMLTREGGPTSHAAILARALGIPALSGVGEEVASLPDGAWIGVDGTRGALWVDPDKKTRIRLESQRKAWLDQRQKLLLTSHEPGRLKDGRKLEVAANIGGLKDARSAMESGADGVGLLRTEFLFLTRETPPGEEEQFAALEPIVAAMQGKPVVVRTLDVGGDKQLPYIQLPPEANPFLGVRAVRLCMQQPDLFLTQLRAILRAGKAGEVRVMTPMVANLDEIDFIHRSVNQAHEELTRAGVAHAWPLQVGIMVEIPAAALTAHELAPHVDFFSIGTNDLTQYTLAAERGNPALAGFADALHPAVLRLIAQVVEGAHAAGKWVGVCGELAGDPLAAPVLVGLGVDELSMNPGSVPRVKDLLRRVTGMQAKALAHEVLAVSSALEARQMARLFVEQLQKSG